MRPAEKMPTSLPSIAEPDLVERAQAGDRWAEDALYRRHAKPVARLVGRLVQHRADAEDVLHDTFVSAFEQLGRLRDPARFGAWLRQIAVTHARRRIRTRALRRRLGLVSGVDDATLEATASSGVSADVRADLAVIDGVLRRLPANDRIAWVLRYVEGHQLEEVAALSGCSLATAKRRIAAAKREMDRVVDVAAFEDSGELDR